MKCKNCIHLSDVIDEDDNPDGYWCPEVCDSPDPEFERDCSKFKPMTNADRVRHMTDEELAKFLLKVNESYAEPCMLGVIDCKHKWTSKGCKNCFLEWLQTEIE